MFCERGNSFVFVSQLRSGPCATGPMLLLQYTDRTNPMDKHVEIMCKCCGMDASPVTAQLFGNAGKEYMEKYGRLLGTSLFALIVSLLKGSLLIL